MIYLLSNVTLCKLHTQCIQNILFRYLQDKVQINIHIRGIYAFFIHDNIVR